MEKLQSIEDDQSLHFIERVNMKFTVELCILPKETAFTWLKVSGNLPRLHLNLSEKKYRAVMRTLDYIGYGFSTSESVPTKAHQGTKDDWIDGLSYSDSPMLTADEFFDAEESLRDSPTIASASVEADLSSASNEELVQMNRIVIEFLFTVGEVSASLQKADPITHEESALADVNIYNFDLKYVSRLFDYKAVIDIASAQILDNTQRDNEQFKYLLSESTRGESGGEVSQKFISIVYDSINRNSPEFKGTDQAADIGFGGMREYLKYQS